MKPWSQQSPVVSIVDPSEGKLKLDSMDVERLRHLLQSDTS